MYFCKEPDGGDLAVLVDQVNGQKVTVYAHDGQHSEADVEYVKTCEPLDKPEQSELYKELVGQGYKEIEVMKKFKDEAATERPVDECVNKMVESVIGGSPICEAVKKIASVIFEGMKMPDYENEIYTDEQEGGDFLDSSMATEEDRLQDKFGTPMRIVGDEIAQSLDPEVRQLEDEEYKKDVEYRKRMMENDAHDKDAFVNECQTAKRAVQCLLRRFSSPADVKQDAYDTLIGWANDYSDEKTALNYLNAHWYSTDPSAERAVQKQIHEICSAIDNKIITTEELVHTLCDVDVCPVRIRTKSPEMVGDYLKSRRNSNRVPRTIPVVNFNTTIYIPIVSFKGKQYMLDSDASDCISDIYYFNNLYKNTSIDDRIGGLVYIEGLPQKHILDEYDFKLMYYLDSNIRSQIVELIVDRTTHTKGDGLDFDDIADSMTPGDKTPEDAYNDFAESHSENDNDDYYSAYKGSSEADDLIKKYDNEQIQKRMDADKDYDTAADLDRWFGNRR